MSLINKLKPIKNLSPVERFKSFIIKTGNCWEWTGTIQPNGYGQFTNNNKKIMAHRFAYELWVETIPEGLVIDHICKNHSCVNPDHLEAVTQKENCLRGDGGKHGNHIKGKNHPESQKTHCPQGHEYTGNNLYIDPKGHRYCISCRKNHDKRRYKLEGDRKHKYGLY